MSGRPTVTGPLVGGVKGWPFGAPDRAAFEARGYVMEEFVLAGTARRYRAKSGTTPNRGIGVSLGAAEFNWLRAAPCRAGAARVGGARCEPPFSTFTR